MVAVKYVFAFAVCVMPLTTRADEPKAVEVGQKAPDFVATGIDGKEFKLSERIGDGERNVVLLFSRAHW
jgi:hypothetical protein